MMPSALRTGFLATLGGAEPVAGVPDGAAHERFEAISLSLWGRPAVDDGHEGRRTFVVSRVARRRDGALDGGEIADAMAVDPALLHDLLPPFGAIQASGGTLRFSGDWMGFEHVFAHDGPGSVMLSTSALLIAERVAAGFDPVGVAVQSQLGWQLASRTLFDGVRKLPPSASASLTADGLSLAADADAANPTDDAAVPHAAGILRRSLERLLDEHPDAVLQLTGGMDSRLLLSAIPPERRRGLHAMTLDVPGAGDVAVARDIARRFGIEHEVHGFAGLDDLSPEDAWASCRAEATRLDCMTDPVALAAQRNAERAFAQGVRISGLGGEVARGFYYVGDVDDRTYERKDAARLADWKLFVNEAVEPGLLTAEFADWARERAVDEVHDALRRGGDEWFRATDALYLRHRMQRWAGATDIAVSDQRVVVNPMLDRDFLAIVSGLPRGRRRTRGSSRGCRWRSTPSSADFRSRGDPRPRPTPSPPRGKASRAPIAPRGGSRGRQRSGCGTAVERRLGARSSPRRSSPTGERTPQSSTASSASRSCPSAGSPQCSTARTSLGRARSRC